MFRLSALLVALAGTASADPLVVQLRHGGLTDAAGLYVAQARGFYRDEGIEPRIVSAVSGQSPMQALAEGRADLATDWVAAGLVAADRGLPVAALDATRRPTSLQLACLPESGVRAFSDLAGQRVAVPLDGTHDALRAMLAPLGLQIGDTADKVQLVEAGPGIEMLTGKRAACLATTADALPAITTALPGGVVTLTPAPETAAADAVYALRPAQGNANAQERLARFARATARGWAETSADPAGAQAILSRVASGSGASVAPPSLDQITQAAALEGGSTVEQTADALRKAGAISGQSGASVVDPQITR